MQPSDLHRKGIPTRAEGELAATINYTGDTPVDVERTQFVIQAQMPEIDSILVGRFRVVAYSGIGSSGVVFRGEHLNLQLPVALKMINRSEYPDRATAIRHLRSEAEILKRLHHPHIVRLWDYYDDMVSPILVLDFIEGQTLEEAIREQGQLDARRILRVGLGITKAIAHAWKFGIVHRDIKPGNIMLARDGSVRLIDYGLATQVQPESPPLTILETYPWVGTAAYMAPEQARSSAAVDFRADIYSLGSTLYHAITGRMPYMGQTIPQVILQRMESDPVPPHQLNPRIDRNVSLLIMRMMARQPQDRFASCAELQTAIQALMA